MDLRLKLDSPSQTLVCPTQAQSLPSRVTCFPIHAVIYPLLSGTDKLPRMLPQSYPRPYLGRYKHRREHRSHHRGFLSNLTHRRGLHRTMTSQIHVAPRMRLRSRRRSLCGIHLCASSGDKGPAHRRR
jgi:hypothetical protein